MHRLFEQVLQRKDLSKAGDLFSLDDSLIVDELSTVLATIQEISNKPEFLTSHNDQSLVEICVTRVISAIRETGSIEKHSDAMICLLESCLFCFLLSIIPVSLLIIELLFIYGTVRIPPNILETLW